MSEPNFTSHKEIDAYYSVKIDALSGESILDSWAQTELFREWRFMKEFFDRRGYAPPRNSRIINLTYTPVLIGDEE